ncbi:heme ABC exporter ATP-binding protein CcmA [Magnetofaba australis]|uniref:Putative heme exporter protein CcmA n=1 Tax=Magnetofaba australis IT-1 TaxID=1434232 RepID=A0A1Y2K0C3_9PROT|nr:heme ABC exporter ATP-binding protein CcmA [Magnetofaba australis]OSM01480.1 putative heme exporter protein CcmA [Magnetofaba australis IT-1]
MVRLQVQGIHYGFGRQKVLNGVDLQAAEGECVALFGDNGAGKSTLLSILATRYKPHKGAYLLNGTDVLKQGEYARENLIFIGHHTHLYGHLSPMENLRFSADLRGLRPSDKALRKIIDEVGLGRFAHRPAKGFSAGMRKRLALGRALLFHPALLLLDEPYSALDSKGVAWLNRLLASYLEHGGTLILASHDPERVAALPNRAVRMTGGKLIAESKHADDPVEETQPC